MSFSEPSLMKSWSSMASEYPQRDSESAGGAATPHQQEVISITLLCRHIPKKHPVQTMALAYWSFHYAKRIFETFVVHRCDEGALCS